MVANRYREKVTVKVKEYGVDVDFIGWIYENCDGNILFSIQ